MFTGGLGGNSISKFIYVSGQIHFLVIIDCRARFPCWLSSRGWSVPCEVNIITGSMEGGVGIFGAILPGISSVTEID